jgi:hypothetical protein
MIWLAPWALLAGGAGMLGVLAAHLLSRQRPRALALATARFLPAGMLEATTLQRVPMDRWWLLLRLLIIALMSAGVAQPVFTDAKVPRRTVLLLDRTLPVDAQRAALASLTESDVVIPFDTAAAVMKPAAVLPAVFPDARLSAGMAAVLRVRDSLSAQSTELRVAIASRFSQRSLDPATPTLRALLRDSIVVLPVSVAPDTALVRGAVRLRVRGGGDDPIAATAQLLGDSVAQRGTIIQRAAQLPHDDSAAVDAGATLVWWPTKSIVGVPALQGITVGTATWIAPLGRDSTDTRVLAGHAIGWWADGAPAVWRTDIGRGCLLRVYATVPTAGDQTLSLAAQAWLAALLTACDPHAAEVAPAPAWLAAPATRALTRDVRDSLVSRSAVWLVGAALSLALLELVLRRIKRA